MMKEAQEAVKKISSETHKKEVFTSSFFITLLAEQVGQVAEKYLSEGRLAKDIEVDIADVIVVSLAYLNWLEKDGSEAFRKALVKHERAITRSSHKMK
jgi:NTP pyrophosphatase (non-canonical NTP hydrolase)